MTWPSQASEGFRLGTGRTSGWKVLDVMPWRRIDSAQHGRMTRQSGRRHDGPRRPGDRAGSGQAVDTGDIGGLESVGPNPVERAEKDSRDGHGSFSSSSSFSSLFFSSVGESSPAMYFADSSLDGGTPSACRNWDGVGEVSFGQRRKRITWMLAATGTETSIPTTPKRCAPRTSAKRAITGWSPTPPPTILGVTTLSKTCSKTMIATSATIPKTNPPLAYATIKARTAVLNAPR